MIYLDTSAMVKLIVAERETPALGAWLDGESTSEPVTSSLGRVELMRAVKRSEVPGAAGRADQLLATLDMVPLTERILKAAETIGTAHLRSLDAIHLACATALGDQLDAVVTYDHRLIDACATVGVRVATPS